MFRISPHCLSLLFALALVASPAGATPFIVAGSSGCRHADVVFYTTDSVRLATELSKTSSSCADYYISVAPTATGAPRGGAPVTTIHSIGPRFHALAEIRLDVWASYASAHGWYPAGLEARREMAEAGYQASIGDSWAINEVGGPSGSNMGVNVFANKGTARQDLREFVHGLYVGDGVPRRGLVFVADPLQVAPDVSQYRRDLRSWYLDTAFWKDMARYVRFWAQETYADARAWGVAGAPSAQRNAYMNDYFLHGIRLAQAGDGSSAAARTYLAQAYTPVGNASYRWPNPDAISGIGFGATDLDPAAMQSFVTAQTDVLRTSSPARFGFAFVPHAASATDTLALTDQLAAAIHASDTGGTNACSVDEVACAADVGNAHFSEAWKAFANTLEGSRVKVRIGPIVKVTFAVVNSRGATQVTTSPLPDSLQRSLRRWPNTFASTIRTTASYAGKTEICLTYKPDSRPGRSPHVFQRHGSTWADITTVVAPAFVCGRTSTLGTFAALTH